MLRRWIPVICVPVLAVMGIALLADVAAAGPLQRLRDRMSSRRGSDDNVVVYDSQPVVQQQSQQQQQYVSQPLMVQEYQQSGRRFAILPRNRGSQGSPIVPATYVAQQPLQQTVVQAGYTQPQPLGSQPVMTSGQLQQEWVMQDSGRRGLLRRNRGGGQMVLVSTQPQQQFQPMPQTGYRVYYRVPTPDAPAGTVLLNVRVPAEAQIWIEGDKTQQSGSFRRFVSPPLDQGKSYAYQIKAEWQENGKKITRTRKVTVHAGEAVDIDLSRPTQQELRQQQQQSEDR